MINSDTVVVLVTTYNRPELLKERALESILNQSRHQMPSYWLIILMRKSHEERTNLRFMSFLKTVFTLSTNGHRSAAGTWNQGLQYIK